MIGTRSAACLFVLLTLVLPTTLLAAEGGVARGGEVEIAVEPSSYRLAHDTEAEVVAKLPEGAQKVIFLAAHGRVADITLDGRRATAVYRPPDDFLPRVDVIAALIIVGGEPRWGFVALPLIGQGSAVIKTRPFAKAEIHIGEKVYGPVKANRRGKAEIEVEVPPGTTFGIDGEGNEVDLHVPTTPRTAVFPSKPELPMDRAEPVEVLAVIVGRDGGPPGDEKPVLTADRGRIEEPRDAGGGAFIADYIPPEEGTGVVQIEAGVLDDESPFSVAEIVLVPGGQEPGGPSDGAAGTGDGEDDRPPPNIPWLSSALKAGFAWNLGSLQSFDIMVDATVKLPLWRDQLRLGVEVGFSRFGNDSKVQTGSLQGTGLESATWIVPIAGGFAFAQPLGDSLSLVLGVQGAAVLVDNQVTLGGSGGGNEQNERGWKPGVGGALAFEWKIGPGAALFEARYLWIGGELESMRGNLSQLYLNLGYRFFFLD